MGKKVICPQCGRRMVYVAVVVSGYLFHSWQCDCAYRIEAPEYNPPRIVGDIMRAREFDDGSVCYNGNQLLEADDD